MAFGAASIPNSAVGTVDSQLAIPAVSISFRESRPQATIFHHFDRNFVILRQPRDYFP
jgi:hypothetical protein